MRTASPSKVSRRVDRMPIRSPEKLAASVPARNELFKKYSTRTERPVINFSTCTKCTLCWLNCPDASFDVTPDGTYDANLESCCGCGICEDVCPVKDCVTMVNESEFHENDSQYTAFKTDKGAYLKWLETTIEKAEPIEKRSRDSVIAVSTKNRSPKPWKSRRKASGPATSPKTRRLRWRH